MKKNHISAIAMALFFVTVPVWAQSGAEVEGRVLLVVEEAPAAESNAGVKPAIFDENSKPGPGKHLGLYADADSDSFLLVVALHPNERRLANGWRPELVSLTAAEEIFLPKSPATWDWNEGSDPFELYVVFIPKSAAGVADLRALVTAMQNPAAEAQLLDLQTNKLREQILNRMDHQDPAAFHAAQIPQAWGGTLRGAKFAWRPMAQKVPFSDEKHGFLIYRYELA